MFYRHRRQPGLSDTGRRPESSFKPGLAPWLWEFKAVAQNSNDNIEGIALEDISSSSSARCANVSPELEIRPLREYIPLGKITRSKSLWLKYVYFFGGNADGNKDMKNLLGGKGANLAEMVNLGIPVPPGFTITTEVCTSSTKRKRPGRGSEGSHENLNRLEEAHGHEIRRRHEPAPRFRPFRRPGFHARHDGHGPQPRPE